MTVSTGNGRHLPDETGSPLPRLVDISAVARSLGISVRHVRRLVTDRRIPFVKVGYFVRFDPDEVSRWIDARRVEIADRSVRRPVTGVGRRALAPRAGAGRRLDEDGTARARAATTR